MHWHGGVDGQVCTTPRHTTHTHTPHTHTHAQTHMHTNIYTHTHTCTHKHKHIHTHTHMHKQTHTHMHTQTQTYTQTHTHMHTQTQTYTQTHTHMHTQTQTYTHTHTHTHTHTLLTCTYMLLVRTHSPDIDLLHPIPTLTHTPHPHTLHSHTHAHTPHTTPHTPLTLSTSQYEGHSVPTLILDVEHGRGKGGRDRPLGDRGVVQVPLLGLPLPLGVAHVLTQDHVPELQFRHTAKHFHLHREGRGRGWSQWGVVSCNDIIRVCTLHLSAKQKSHASTRIGHSYTCRYQRYMY